MSPLNRSAYDLTAPEWSALCEEWSVPAFRAAQIRRWLFDRQVATFSEMANLPLLLRARLAATLHDLEETARLRETSGTEGQTRKLLLELHDGQCIETVLIPARDRTTVCVSSQAGCAFACAFCASGKRGLARDLSTGEIVAQVLHAWRLIGTRPSNIVFMGIGEPFANYDAVLRAVRTLNDPDELGIGARHITLSTCGVVPGIRRLAEEGLQVELSVSLHAPTDEQRSVLMPVNKRWPLAALMAACRDYTARTNRIITFEYTLVADTNDQPEDANALLGLLRGLKCRVNLIPLSPVAEFDGQTPPTETLHRFRDALERAGVNTTLRLSRGSDLDAACGQLRLRAVQWTVNSGQ
jgi:23S rRNA (adenine2503-C2)-methyltransferase